MSATPTAPRAPRCASRWRSSTATLGGFFDALDALGRRLRGRADRRPRRPRHDRAPAAARDADGAARRPRRSIQGGSARRSAAKLGARRPGAARRPKATSMSTDDATRRAARARAGRGDSALPRACRRSRPCSPRARDRRHADADRRRPRPGRCSSAPAPRSIRRARATSWCCSSRASRRSPTPRRGYVATHGSPWDYDRRVPILFWRKGMAGFEQPLSVETVDIAPTLARDDRPAAAPALDGRCLDLDAGRDDTCR